ncbi:class I adenylate-forming enzyme family protein [Brevibacterium litoralis]|uniref:class I adenylate-forming enzyme family protein n=1 Tax=Brevibacterium litoralis TaxID=3138935 RepID=UPI0032EDBA77
MTWFDERPWLATAGKSADSLVPVPESATLELLARNVDQYPDRTALHYFGWEVTWAELDRMADAFAAHLQDQGFGAGGRLGLYLQNVPHFVVATWGAWKAGGAVVPLNPMYKDELLHVFEDAGVTALVTSAALYLKQSKPYADTLPLVFTCQERDWAVDQPESVFGKFPEHLPTGQADFRTVVEENLGRTPDRTAAQALTADDVALIGYTSGTSGRSKGAGVLHRGLTSNGRLTARNQQLETSDAVFTLAPVFHITGFCSQFITSAAAGSTLVMNYRFEPGTALQLFRATRPAFMAGPSTAYMAMLAHPDFDADAFSSIRSCMSGGAALPASVVERIRAKTGRYVRQGYGLTETTAQCAVVPMSLEAPVDEASGNLSCGLPLETAMVRIRDEEGVEVGPNEVGEICVSGPMVIREYLNLPEATVEDIPDGELRTGDVGFMDEAGWLFIVDRKKDMINASGFKVWPREVEDMLYTLPEVLEAAVVGMPDEYRGESVVAFITLRPGTELTPEQVIEYCRKHLAAYKAPHTVEIVDELPKTASGKILRREMKKVAEAKS